MNSFILNQNPKISKKFSRTPLNQKLKEDIGFEILVVIIHQFRDLTSLRYDILSLKLYSSRSPKFKKIPKVF